MTDAEWLRGIVASGWNGDTFGQAMAKMLELLDLTDSSTVAFGHRTVHVPVSLIEWLRKEYAPADDRGGESDS